MKKKKRERKRDMAVEIVNFISLRPGVGRTPKDLEGLHHALVMATKAVAKSIEFKKRKKHK